MTEVTRGTQVALRVAKTAVEDAIKDLKAAGQGGGEHTINAVELLESAMAEIERAIATHDSD